MEPETKKGWLRRRAERALLKGLDRAYNTMRVDPQHFLNELRQAHGLPVQSYDGMFTLPVERLDAVAQSTIRGAMKFAAFEAAGFDLGGLAGIFPDMGVLAFITMRTIQRLSLVYGFEFNSDEERAELWIAAATAAGADISRELLERHVLRVFIQRVSARIAAKIGAEVAEKFAARALPIASSAIGAVLNWYFVRAWGKRALAHFRQRHLAERARRAQSPPMRIILPPPPPRA